MKKALVLGVGSAQDDLIVYLKRQGWWVIGCSYRFEGKGLDHVDQFELIDVKDTQALIRLGEKEKVELVYSIGSDIAVPSIAVIAEKLGLPYFISLDVANLTHNKIALRKFLNDRCISTVRFRAVTDQSDLDDWNIYPALMKPADNQGQRGIILVRDQRESIANLEKVREHAFGGQVIIEEFLEGPEISVNAFCVGSEITLMKISDRIIVESYPGGIPKAHIYPSRVCHGEVEKETLQLVGQCIQALGIKAGPVYFQIKLTRHGPRIIEIAPRLDGCHLWRLFQIVDGDNLLEMAVNLLVNNNQAITHGSKSLRAVHSLNFFLSPPNETFRRDHFPAPVGAKFVDYYYKDAELIRPINSFRDKVGYYIQEEAE